MGDSENSQQGSNQQKQTDQNNSGGDSQSGSNSQSGGSKSEQQQQRASRVEKGIIVISIILTLLLFSYAGWQIATPPQIEVPQSSVVGTEPLADGTVAVTVELQNPSDVGLISATIESNCTSPPPDIQFSYVPAASTRTGTIVCPPGTTDPSVSLSNWKSR